MGKVLRDVARVRVPLEGIAERVVAKALPVLAAIVGRDKGGFLGALPSVAADIPSLVVEASSAVFEMEASFSGPS